MDAHLLIQALKEMAITLGRTPTRDEFVNSIRSGRRVVTQAFGDYTALVLASGLEPAKFSTKRGLPSAIFEKSIRDHIAAYVPKVPAPHDPWPSLASISDIHWPFPNLRVIEAFKNYVKLHKPDWVVLNGDAWDMYSHTKFPRTHNLFTPKEEMAMAREQNTEFWADIQKLSPGSKCIQMMGNHDVRPLKRIMEVYPAAEDWIAEKLKEIFTFSGVQTIMDTREELFVSSNVIVFHGYKSQLGAHRDYTMLNTINGHTHRGGVVFRKIRGATLWELNSGLAGDPEAKGLTYTQQKITEWTPGFGAVDQYGPRFIPI